MTQQRNGGRVQILKTCVDAAFAKVFSMRKGAAHKVFRARELISLAVEAHPAHVGLRTFETGLSDNLPDEISWYKISLPPRKENEPEEVATY
jgi:hypothetical protein